jgi:aspartyl-tRNA(Asn)/glutamyl-tRNA(Gln) amidotransferase subunit A
MDQMSERRDGAGGLSQQRESLVMQDGDVSRRNFLKVAGLAGAGMATGLNLTVNAAASKPEVCFMSVPELGQRIQGREISPVEVTEAFLARITEHNAQVKAFIYVDRDGALQQAREAETEIQKGHYRGALHGIPVAYKDIFDVRGLPTTAASKILAGNIAAEDSAVVTRLRDAGTICIGKLNLWEFASGSMEVFGDARNPWNTEMITGGSSAGSGAALAANLVPLATGTDTGGSVRGPAHNCGVVGLRPSRGRVSRVGIIPLSWSLDEAGPMARTVSDVAVLFKAMAGFDARDVTVSEPAAEFNFSPIDGLKGKRIGLPRPSYFTGVDPEVALALQNAVQQMEKLGASVQELDLSPSGYGAAASWTIAYSEAFAFHRPCFGKRWTDYTPAFRRRITSAAMLTAEECGLAQRIRQVITMEFLRNLTQVDIIVTPTQSHPASPIGKPSPLSDMLNFLRPVSLTGLPGLSVPCGFTQAGLPIGMQLIGRFWDEATVLGVGHAYEQSAGWYRRHAPIAPGPLPPPLQKGTDKPKKVAAGWVMDIAKSQGFDFITPADAEAIAPITDPVRALLLKARPWLETVAPTPWPVLAG